jgi:hypothetical protein
MRLVTSGLFITMFMIGLAASVPLGMALGGTSSPYARWFYQKVARPVRYLLGWSALIICVVGLIGGLLLDSKESQKAYQADIVVVLAAEQTFYDRYGKGTGSLSDLMSVSSDLRQLFEDKYELDDWKIDYGQETETVMVTVDKFQFKESGTLKLQERG